jgi:hypothetical protein
MEIHHPLSNLRISFEPLSHVDSRDLVLHFHGAHEVVRKAAHGRFPHAIVASVNLSGLSGAYDDYVGRSPRMMFASLLAEILQATHTDRFDSITLSSFSAGYGAIRALLKEPCNVDIIDQLVLADTVYSSFGEQRNSIDSRPYPRADQNKPFIDFAKLAVRSKKGMVLTHCELEPEGYSSTAEVGQLVRDAVGVSLQSVDQMWTNDVRIKGHVRKGRFVSVATRGMQGSDHLAHLRALGTWYRMLSRF